MMKILFLIPLSLVILFQQETKPGSVQGRFVAVDKLQALTNPREPRQQLIVEVQNARLFAKGQLIRVVYFAETTSLRGGAKFLGIETWGYANTWNLKTHHPTTANERAACADVDNFFRAADGSIDENEKHEPILRYRSTQSKADMKFDDLSVMPCVILDSLEH